MHDFDSTVSVSPDGGDTWSDVARFTGEFQVMIPPALEAAVRVQGRGMIRVVVLDPLPVTEQALRSAVLRLDNDVRRVFVREQFTDENGGLGERLMLTLRFGKERL